MYISFEDYVNIELEETEIQAINNFLSKHGIQRYLESLVTCCNYKDAISVYIILLHDITILYHIVNHSEKTEHKFIVHTLIESFWKLDMANTNHSRAIISEDALVKLTCNNEAICLLNCFKKCIELLPPVQIKKRFSCYESP